MQQPPNPYNAPPSLYAPPPPSQFQQGKRVHRLKNKKSLCIIGCGSLAGLVLLIGLISGLAATLGKTANSPTPTATTAIVNQVTPTHAPTSVPTKKPALIPTQKPTPRAQPTQPPVHPTPTQPACQAINNNPWCYNFSPGKLIYIPPNSFCNYFNCIATFYGPDDPGDGYIVQCVDGSFSQSGGESGACSYHGGVSRPLYSH